MSLCLCVCVTSVCLYAMTVSVCMSVCVFLSAVSAVAEVAGMYAVCECSVHCMHASVHRKQLRLRPPLLHADLLLGAGGSPGRAAYIRARALSRLDAELAEATCHTVTRQVSGKDKVEVTKK